MENKVVELTQALQSRTEEKKALQVKRDAQNKRKPIPPFVQKLSRYEYFRLRTTIVVCGR